jgi:short-subunit dehydrogenase
MTAQSPTPRGSFSYAGSVAVVTGASAGLGRQFALDLAAAGALVVGIARRRELLSALAETLQGRSPGSTVETCDVADHTSFRTVLTEVEHRHSRIDVLINNAAVGEPDEDDGSDPLERHRRVMAVNYFAPVVGTYAVLPGMAARGRGAVVNVSSDTGRAPGPGDTAYGASKAALTAFTESVSFETEGTGVSIHLLYPGWVPTDMGAGAVAQGMSLPPKSVRRTPEQVSRLLLSRIGGPKVDIDATMVARLAPVARAVAPRLYRRGVRHAGGG